MTAEHDTETFEASEASTRLEAAYLANAADLLSYLGRRVADRADAADLLGETFLVAARRAALIPRDEEQARMWLFGVARRVLANAARGDVRRVRLAARLREQVAALPPELPTDDAIEVRAAIERLPVDQAEVVRLVLWDGFTLAQAAAIVGASEPAVRSRYQRARATLRALLHEHHSGRSIR
ncbi:sigma-70 family RNA polymerase sigma factor [Agromyces intestinalis]|uniref:Sigma-70 family RNA polymerase sigma factor n=1 Tax=Agromyces intestinalis TaxID=2592652 RepID=A0A5C1YEM3_9MICO|nr:sigma-70 family RNA polymerase sigma factor [Agromyces intestinalis]QEO14556.1 sigma-70 family RNA polymerase sigma factor [Agromyces intestinalis]